MEENVKDKIVQVSVEDILPNRFQPRLAFDEKELTELSNSIVRYGIIQPLVLRSIGDKYEIIAGERRYKASVLAGLKFVPAIINNTDDNTSAEIELLENLQRKNLTPIEEAQSYRKLMDKNFTQEDIATKLGVSQSSIANKLRLLNLPKKVQNALLYGKISERHARSLLSLNDEELQLNLLERIINERLTVKQTEDEISYILNKSKYDNDIPSEIQRFIDAEKAEFVKEETQEEPKIEYSNKPYFPNAEDKNIRKLLEVSRQVDVKPIGNNVPEILEIDDSGSSNIQSNVSVDNEVSQEIKLYDSPIIEPDLFSQNVEVVKNVEIKEEKESDVSTEELSYLTSDSEVNIPKVVSKVRNTIRELDQIKSLITTTELDLEDKYQIIIEINKNTHLN